MNAKSFLFYLDNKEVLADLSDAQLGLLLRCLIEFAETGDSRKISDPVVFMAYKFMTAQMRRDMEKYEKKCRKNAENARKGGAPAGNKNALKNKTGKNNRTVDKTTETSERLKKQPKQPYTDTDTNTDTETEKDTDTETDISVKPVRHKYGEYQNVLLSDEDLQKLKTEFPYDYRERIERLSEYMASTGKSYRNHLATIRAWAKKENGMNQGKKPEEKPQEPKRGPVEVLNGVIEIW